MMDVGRVVLDIRNFKFCCKLMQNKLFYSLKCERLKKKRSSVLGSLRLAHDLSINEVDAKILAAR